MHMSVHIQPPKSYGNFVDGKQIGAVDGATFGSTNPTSGSHWGDFALSTAADVDAAVRSAHAAFSGA
jgi:acyl-CoA reductase-like NAD-dependent aldehyde dehydrogenase